MKNKRKLTMLELLGVVLVLAIIAVCVINVRPRSFTRTTDGNGNPSQTTIGTTTQQ